MAREPTLEDEVLRLNRLVKERDQALRERDSEVQDLRKENDELRQALNFLL